MRKGIKGIMFVDSKSLSIFIRLPFDLWPDDEIFVLILAHSLNFKITIYQFSDDIFKGSLVYEGKEVSKEICLSNKNNIHYSPLKMEENIQSIDQLF